LSDTPSDVYLIERVEIWPCDVQLVDPFAISSGTVRGAQILYVSLTTSGGVRGFGEIAPLEPITHENREKSDLAVRHLIPVISGNSLLNYRRLSQRMKEELPRFPAARCGLETAMLDAFCRSIGVPLWAFWGGAAEDPMESDITIPLLDTARSLAIASHWTDRGFKTFKIKVGTNPDTDLDRLEKISQAFPTSNWILDANAAFTERDATYFIKKAAQIHHCIRFFEQPVHAEDLQGLAALKRNQKVAILADESVLTLEDARKVIAANAADAINIKIMKSGVLESVEIVSLAHAAGIGLMAGGMVETRVAMGCSLSMAVGLGGFSAIDLDTPLLMVNDPVKGGYEYDGPILKVTPEPGLGVQIS